MRKFIKWLADISGVTLKIQVETYKEIGGRMYQDHYWWNGGIMYLYPQPQVMRAFELYAEAYKNGCYPDINQIRDQVYKEFPRSKKITVALLRDLETQVINSEISYSKMVEILNEHKSPHT